MDFVVHLYSSQNFQTKKSEQVMSLRLWSKDLGNGIASRAQHVASSVVYTHLCLAQISKSKQAENFGCYYSTRAICFELVALCRQPHPRPRCSRCSRSRPLPQRPRTPACRASRPYPAPHFHPRPQNCRSPWFGARGSGGGTGGSARAGASFPRSRLYRHQPHPHRRPAGRRESGDD